MITCIINGHRAYPISTSSIKVTYANQYVTDDGEYTYDITFPMNILANREIFSNVSRMEVKKNIAKFDDCKLYVDSRIIMSGVGTILSVNQQEVKLTITFDEKNAQTEANNQLQQSGNTQSQQQQGQSGYSQWPFGGSWPFG